jgi:hypothetical protein
MDEDVGALCNQRRPVVICEDPVAAAIAVGE